MFFDNTWCERCGLSLGFDAVSLEMVSGQESAGSFLSNSGMVMRRCANQARHGNCNWLLRPEDPNELCRSCRLNQVIPTLGRAGNLELWTRVEQAKKRLVRSLLEIGLPFVDDAGNELAFRIMEDRRRNPDVLESFVPTAHQGGVITINILEADDASRVAARQQMAERYRTVLGHLRHESGHFFFWPLAGHALDECRALFGDERLDYEGTLKAFYETGPPLDWPERHVSAYAASHPAEDFAETFAHYLHITDALETAGAAGLEYAHDAGEASWILAWADLSITLNEILRSLGGDDPYPFVLTDPVVDKLRFMDRIVRRRAVQPDDSPAGWAVSRKRP